MSTVAGYHALLVPLLLSLNWFLVRVTRLFILDILIETYSWKDLDLMLAQAGMCCWLLGGSFEIFFWNFHCLEGVPVFFTPDRGGSWIFRTVPDKDEEPPLSPPPRETVPDKDEEPPPLSPPPPPREKWLVPYALSQTIALKLFDDKGQVFIKFARIVLRQTHDVQHHFLYFQARFWLQIL